MMLAILSIVMWPVHFAAYLPMIVLGWVLVPIACFSGAYKITDKNEQNPKDGPIYHFTWEFMHPWDNSSDGIANRNYKQFDVLWKQIIYWSCVRNPVANYRTLPVLGVKIKGSKLKWVGSFGSNREDVSKYKTKKEPFWVFTRQGLYSSLRIQYFYRKKMREFWIGHKLMPYDVLGVTSYRREGAGFTIQWRTV